MSRQPSRHHHHCPHPSNPTSTPLPVRPELPKQLAFKTSSLKKRRISSRHSEREPSNSPSPDTALPSCEPDDETSFSFSAPGPDSPPFYRRAASQQPASSLPQRLQLNGTSLVSADYASSTASSPCASACADLNFDSDKGGDEAGPALDKSRGQSPYRVTRRAMMNGDADLPHRSSSPLKRRASSMEPEGDSHIKGGSDTQGSSCLPRAMSVDPPEDHRSGPAENTPNSE